ncbi:hypothetical protein J437_LFUL007531 [Ladona fulva]|uniref:ATP-dependent DNA helicase n=1 Tax=Ladona fulva TaxID=123851 RepID=A0A8K0K448_LADFU|nr:hypothetical protein J437_LFUL007531 [Ladona fulva]
MILANVRLQRKIALAVALSAKTPVCNIMKQSNAAKLFSECHLIVWDECTRGNKLDIEALNHTLQNIWNKEKIMCKLNLYYWVIVDRPCLSYQEKKHECAQRPRFREICLCWVLEKENSSDQNSSDKFSYQMKGKFI